MRRYLRRLRVLRLLRDLSKRPRFHVVGFRQVVNLGAVAVDIELDPVGAVPVDALDGNPLLRSNERNMSCKLLLGRERLRDRRPPPKRPPGVRGPTLRMRVTGKWGTQRRFLYGRALHVLHIGYHGS